MNKYSPSRKVIAIIILILIMTMMQTQRSHKLCFHETVGVSQIRLLDCVSAPLILVELAMIMDRLYGGVCYAGIDTDPELKYPKGAGRVAFSNQQSYIAAISARFVQLQHGEIDKRVSPGLCLESSRNGAPSIVRPVSDVGIEHSEVFIGYFIVLFSV